MLWNISELRQALQPLDVRGQIKGVDGISIDSRTLVPNDLFIALPGDPGVRFHTAERSDRDGHDYIQDAAHKGAACALVSDFVDVDIPQIRVADVIDGLWALAAASRRRTQATVLGLTGSSGKTTLKYFLAAATAGYSSKASLNNFLGLPLSMARLPASESIAIFELGMNRAGEIAQLSELLRPDIAVLLNVLPVHMEGLGSLAAITKEKLSIVRGLPQDGLLVLPDNLDAGRFWKGRTITFGESVTADVRLISEGQGSECQIQAGKQILNLQLPAPGRHRQLTASAALASVLALAGDLQQAALGLAKAEIAEGRGNIFNLAGISIIDESYNANPESMALALQSLKQHKKGARYAILGDMLELGTEAKRYHQALASHCLLLDGIWLVGPLMGLLAQLLPSEQVRAQVLFAQQLDIPAIAALLSPEDVILVKGSNRVFWQVDFVAQLLQKTKQAQAVT